MATILQKAWHGYIFVFDELPDPRTKNWPLVAKPYQGLLLIGLYLMFVLKWGPRWMRNQKPFNLDALLIVYNALQVIACMYLFVNALTAGWGWDYKWICEPVDYTNTTNAVSMAKIAYMYYLLKIVDLLDTVFFVLRKKNSQTSFLHLYHHAGMVMLTWGAATYYPGGHGTLVGVINSLVHVIMYSYYLLTVAYPNTKNKIWLKKLVTQVQILQFFLCVVHMGTIVFKPDCAYPRWISALFLPQNFFMLVLFTDFYIKTYIKTPKQKLKYNNTKENGKGPAKHSNGVSHSNRESHKNDLNNKNNNITLNKIDSNGFASYQNGSKDNIYEKVIELNEEKYKKYE